MKYEMTVHEALSELKVLGSRIDKEISQATFVLTNKHSNVKIEGKSIEETKNEIKADYQKISDLIARRNAIKRAVVLSNANTTIAITDKNGKTVSMSVAEAIEYKKAGLDYNNRLLNAMTSQYKIATREEQRQNGEVLESRANEHIKGLFGGKDKDVDTKAVEETKRIFIENNTLDLIDPIDCKKEISRLSDEADFFNSKIDSALSVSNATTVITFEV